MKTKKAELAIDPAASELMKYARTCKIDIAGLPAWKVRFLADYLQVPKSKLAIDTATKTPTTQ